MARVTVEDCVLKIPNRFELVMLSAQRARDISAGAVLSVERDDDKNPVVALREIAEETVSLDDLNDSLVLGLQKHVEIEEPDEDQPEFDMAGKEMEIEAAAAAGRELMTADALAVDQVDTAEELAENDLAEIESAPALDIGLEPAPAFDTGLDTPGWSPRPPRTPGWSPRPPRTPGWSPRRRLAARRRPKSPRRGHRRPRASWRAGAAGLCFASTRVFGILDRSAGTR